MDQVSFHFCVLRAPAARAKKTWWCRKMRAAHFSTPPCHVFRRGPVARGVTPPCHVFRRGPVARRHARRAHTMSCFPARPSRAGGHTTMSFWRGPVARGAHHHVFLTSAVTQESTPPCLFGAAQSREGPTSEGEDAGDQASSSGLLPRTVT